MYTRSLLLVFTFIFSSAAWSMTAKNATQQTEVQATQAGSISCSEGCCSGCCKTLLT